VTQQRDISADLDRTPSALLEPSCPIESAALVYFDLETTGLHPERGATVTEIAVLEDGGSQFAWDVEQSTSDLSTVLPQLMTRLGDHIVVGHNLAFDLGFLAYEAARRDIRGPKVRFVDTLSMAKRSGLDYPSHELGGLVDHFGIDHEGEFHSAVGDVRATKELFWRLVEENGLETLADAGMSRLDWAAV